MRGSKGPSKYNRALARCTPCQLTHSAMRGRKAEQVLSSPDGRRQNTLPAEVSAVRARKGELVECIAFHVMSTGIQLCWASKAAMHPPAETFFYKKVCEKFACGQKFSLRKIYEKISRINFAKKIRRRIRFAASGIEGFNSLAQLRV